MSAPGEHMGGSVPCWRAPRQQPKKWTGTSSATSQLSLVSLLSWPSFTPRPWHLKPDRTGPGVLSLMSAVRQLWTLNRDHLLWRGRTSPELSTCGCKVGLWTILTPFHSVRVSSPVHLFTCSPVSHFFTPELWDTNTWASRNSTTTFSLLQRAAIFLRLLPSTKRHVTASADTLRSKYVGKLSIRREMWNP